MFKIWVDADSCPSEARKIILKASTRLNLPIIFVANRDIPIKSKEKINTDLFTMIKTPSLPDAADNYIVENATEKDLVITRDIPLANRLVEKNISVINDRGTKFTQNNIKELLSIRNFNHELAQIGITGEKVKNYGQKEIAKFSNCLDKELQIKIKNNNN